MNNEWSSGFVDAIHGCTDPTKNSELYLDGRALARQIGATNFSHLIVDEGDLQPIRFFGKKLAESGDADEGLKMQLFRFIKGYSVEKCSLDHDDIAFLLVVSDRRNSSSYHVSKDIVGIVKFAGFSRAAKRLYREMEWDVCVDL